MGWKGTVRSLQGSARRSEQNAHRRHRELQRRQKEYAKMEALEQAAYEVEVYENHVDILLSMHEECAEPVKWKQLLSNQAGCHRAFESFAEISHLGSAIQMIVHEGGVLEAKVAIHGST